MDRTKVIIGCLSPLLALEDPHLETFITRQVGDRWCPNVCPVGQSMHAYCVSCRSECACLLVS